VTEFLSIRVEDHLPYAPARVWKALTDQGYISQWLMPSDFQLKLGHQFTFHTDPIPAVNFDGTILCRVLEIEPERKLKISWGEGTLDTTVLWELSPEGTGTHLTMVHDGFDPANPMHKFAHQGMGDGWRNDVIPGLARFLSEQVAQEA
jgi:uncharacterized protein YndB with AHSA1/START domain